jgi:hypothetical protein
LPTTRQGERFGWTRLARFFDVTHILPLLGASLVDQLVMTFGGTTSNTQIGFRKRFNCLPPFSGRTRRRLPCQQTCQLTRRDRAIPLALGFSAFQTGSVWFSGGMYNVAASCSSDIRGSRYRGSFYDYLYPSTKQKSSQHQNRTLPFPMNASMMPSTLFLHMMFLSHGKSPWAHGPLASHFETSQY